MYVYYLQTWYIQVASQIAERIKFWYLRKLENIINVSKLHRTIAFNLKLERLSGKKVLKFPLIGNCSSDLFTEVEI